MSEPRVGRVQRKTRETQVDLSLTLDGSGQHDIQTGIPFLDHMLTHVAVHGMFDLSVRARGDLPVDDHHTAEDVGICLGKALDQALGERAGIARMGSATVPMDEALAQVAVDLSGRPYAVIEATFERPAIGGLSTDLIAHILESVALHGRMNLHGSVRYGKNEHHKAEALFKALGRALRQAVALDPARVGIPSSKGVL